MKALLMTFALMMAGPTFADEDTAINTLAGMADEMNDYMEFYYIFFTDIDDEGVVDYSSRCAYGENFKRINRYHLRNKIRKVYRLGFEDLALEGPNFELQIDMFEVNDYTQDLAKAYRGKRLEICKETSTPAYSDGQEIFVVKVDGEVTFLFGAGYPD